MDCAGLQLLLVSLGIIMEYRDGLWHSTQLDTGLEHEGVLITHVSQQAMNDYRSWALATRDLVREQNRGDQADAHKPLSWRLIFVGMFQMVGAGLLMAMIFGAFFVLMLAYGRLIGWAWGM